MLPATSSTVIVRAISIARSAGTNVRACQAAIRIIQSSVSASSVTSGDAAPIGGQVSSNSPMRRANCSSPAAGGVAAGPGLGAEGGAEDGRGGGQVQVLVGAVMHQPEHRGVDKQSDRGDHNHHAAGALGRQLIAATETLASEPPPRTADQRVSEAAVPKLSIGSATVAVPPKNFSARALIESARRCLHAAQSSRNSAMKSIEVY